MVYQKKTHIRHCETWRQRHHSMGMLFYSNRKLVRTDGTYMELNINQLRWKPVFHPYIYQQSFACSGIRTRGQRLEQEGPDLSFLSNFFQLFWYGFQGVSRQAKRHSLSIPCPRSTLESCPSQTCPKHLFRVAPRRHQPNVRRTSTDFSQYREAAVLLSLSRVTELPWLYLSIGM